MLTYSFENIDTESMYEHLYRCIKQDILQKKLRAGEKLPSKRSFAKNLGVSTITVESAYAQLVAEGFLYTLPKRGYYVCDLEQETPAPPPRPQPPKSQGAAPERRVYWGDFVGSSVARDMFPFSVWVKLLRDVTASEDEGHPPHRHLRRGHPPAPPGHCRPPLPVPGDVHRPGTDRGWGRGRSTSTGCSSSCWAAAGATPWRTPATSG